MRPENAKQGIVYFIRFSPTIYKVGITSDWKRRSKELKVGRNKDSICKAVMVRNVENPGRLEKIILQKYDNCRLPGSEYLKLNIGQVANIKNMISDKNAYQQVFKHWDAYGRRKNIIDLEIALQDRPELIEQYRRIQNNSQTRKKIPKKKGIWLQGLLIVFIFLIPPIFIAILIIDIINSLLGSKEKGILVKLLENN